MRGLSAIVALCAGCASTVDVAETCGSVWPASRIAAACGVDALDVHTWTTDHGCAFEVVPAGAASTAAGELVDHGSVAAGAESLDVQHDALEADGARRVFETDLGRLAWTWEGPHATVSSAWRHGLLAGDGAWTASLESCDVDVPSPCDDAALEQLTREAFDAIAW